jgi:superfamily II DNA/RNA helicase
VRQVYTHNFHKSLPNIALTFVPLPEEVEDRVQTLVDLLRSKSGVRVEEAHPQDQGLMEEEDAYTDGPRQASELEMKETDDTHITEPTPAMSVDAKESERTAGSKPRPTLVFVNSTMAVDDLHQELQFRGVASCVPFHRFDLDLTLFCLRVALTRHWWIGRRRTGRCRRQRPTGT